MPETGQDRVFGTWSVTFLFVNSQLTPSRPGTLLAGVQCGMAGSGQGTEPDGHGPPEGRGLPAPSGKGITVPSHTVRAPRLASTSRAPSLDFSTCKTVMMTLMTCVSPQDGCLGKGPTAMPAKGPATADTT